MIKQLTRFATTRRVTVGMLAISFILFGGIALNEMSVSLLPSLEYPTFTIRTEYENSGPEEIELLITKPIEEIVGVVKGISRIYSVSSTGRSDVKLEFNWDADMKTAAYEIRDRMDSVQLPLDVDPPILLRFNPSTDPILKIVINHDNSQSVDDLKSLRTFVDHILKKKLDPVAGVAAVKVSGGYEKEIQILPDQYKLAQLNLSINDISTRLREENINMTGGAIKQGSKMFLVRTVNQFQDIRTIKDLIISTKDNNNIRIADVAQVYLGHKDRKSINRLNGEEAIEIAIYKEGDSNTVAVAELVKESLEKFKDELPKGTSITIIDDQSLFIKDAIGNVVNAALIGGLLAILIIYLFLQEALATAIIAALIPVSVISGFFFMFRAGVSLNIMSLGGIALAIGLLVDNGIVVLENIASKFKQTDDPLLAVQTGTEEVGGAIVASTLTTVAVFLPLVFVEGIAGQLFKDQALTVTFTLLVSLCFALILIPMLSSLKQKKSIFQSASGQQPYESRTKIGRTVKGIRKAVFNNLLDYLFFGIKKIFHSIAFLLKMILYVPAKLVNAFYQFIAAVYAKLLPWALNNRFIVLSLASAIFVATLSLVPKLGMDLIPDLDANKIKINFRLAEGETIENTDQYFRKVSKQIGEMADIEFVYGISGQGSKLDVSALSGGENSGQILISVKPDGDKIEVQNKIVELLSKKAGLQSELQTGQFFNLATPVEIELSGYDLDLLKSSAKKIKKALANNSYFINVDDGVEIGNPEIQLYFDQEKISSLGMNVSQVANNVVNKVLGKSETTVHWNDQKVEIRVRAQEEQRNSIDDIKALIINPNSPSPIHLSDVATVKVTQGPGQIHRRDQERVIVVSADIKGTTLGEAVAEVENILAAVTLHPLVKAKITGQNKDLQSSNQSMIFALLLAVFLVYMVLASQFESLIHPFVILFSIPLALIGSVWALYLTGTTISVVVFIGLIMLAGIVVNNAIVLIDLIKQLLKKGHALNDAIISAGKARLRPIIMTTMTTVFGLLPMIISFGGADAGSEIRAPMAITVIGGLLVSTFLTLIVIPALFSLFTRDKHATE
ncbi:MAG: efflux RND transporter permease subunit [Proteobacteria bacterium]|nr:efflux RND transporter permease subunit [Pseudomonadota bacterium]